MDSNTNLHSIPLFPLKVAKKKKNEIYFGFNEKK